MVDKFEHEHRAYRCAGYFKTYGDYKLTSLRIKCAGYFKPCDNKFIRYVISVRVLINPIANQYFTSLSKKCVGHESPCVSIKYIYFTSLIKKCGFKSQCDIYTILK